MKRSWCFFSNTIWRFLGIHFADGRNELFFNIMLLQKLLILINELWAHIQKGSYSQIN